MSDQPKNERLGYLLDVFKLYHGHINTMFNYFLIISGLIVNGYIQALQKVDTGISVATGIALFGALMSGISLLIHVRSRDMLDTIETGLKREEDALFPSHDGFLNASPTRTQWYFRHKYQFPAMYWSFVIAFILLAVFSGWESIRHMFSLVLI